eukprot:4651970-Pyramimonas_sp.AAC.1
MTATAVICNALGHAVSPLHGEAREVRLPLLHGRTDVHVVVPFGLDHVRPVGGDERAVVPINESCKVARHLHCVRRAQQIYDITHEQERLDL